MMIVGLFHVAIKTSNLEATRTFYCDVLGLKEVFIGCPMPGGQAIIHIYAGGPALGADGKAPLGTGAIDHLSLSCNGFHAFRARFAAHGLDHREFLVPGTTLWQLFVYDPSGVQLELTFEGSAEEGAPPDMSPGRAYEAGKSFFDPARYPRLARAVA